MFRCQVIGEFATRLETRTEADVAQEATRHLQKMFPEVDGIVC